MHSYFNYAEKRIKNEIGDSKSVKFAETRNVVSDGEIVVQEKEEEKEVERWHDKTTESVMERLREREREREQGTESLFL